MEILFQQVAEEILIDYQRLKKGLRLNVLVFFTACIIMCILSAFMAIKGVKTLFIKINYLVCYTKKILFIFALALQKSF